MSRLPFDTFRLVVEHTPLVSIDLVVRNARSEMLLGYRRNRPAQGCWFVPGGRIAKDETREAAYARLTQIELGAALPFAEAGFLGAFEHIYSDNFSAEPTFGTHYVVLAYTIAAEAQQLRLPNEQHSHYLWLPDAEILVRPDVHANTKAYCGLTPLRR